MTVNLIFQQINEQWIGVGTPPLQSQSMGSGDLIWLYWVLLESSWSITYQLTLQLSPFPHNRIFGHSSTIFPRCQMRMCHFEKLCTCYCTVEHENLTLAMLILYFILCLTLPLLIPFIAHTGTEGCKTRTLLQLGMRRCESCEPYTGDGELFIRAYQWTRRVQP